MALKDWKLRRANVWKKVKGDYIYITQYGYQGRVRYDVRKTKTMTEGGKSLKKEIKLKSQALKFAKSYMRKN